MLHMRTNAARGTVRHRFRQVYVKMACELAVFLEHNPGKVDVVRLSSDRWTEDHKVIMEALTEGVRMFFVTAQAPAIRTTLRRIPEVSAVRSKRHIASLVSVRSRTWSVPRRQR